MQRNANFSVFKSIFALMHLHQLRYFLRLADKLHFWQTAEDLSITQSALSRHIKSLEDELGFRLFERNQRNVRLTAAGQLLQTEWQRLLMELEAVQRHAHQVSTGEVGSLRIGHIGSVAYAWLPQLLAGFTARYPFVQAELIEVIATDPEQRLLTYQVDVGFWREPARSSTLASTPVFSEPLALVVPEAHPARAATFGSLADMRNEPFILPSLASDVPYMRALKQIFEHYGYQPRSTIMSDFGTTILNLVAAGLGVSVLPFSYASGPLRGVRFIELPHHSPVFMVWRHADSSAVLQHLLAEATKLAASVPPLRSTTNPNDSGVSAL